MLSLVSWSMIEQDMDGQAQSTCSRISSLGSLEYTVLLCNPIVTNEQDSFFIPRSAKTRNIAFRDE